MSQSLEQTVIAEIKRFAAFTPSDLKRLAFTTHSDIRSINEELSRDSKLSADELAHGRMLYKDFLTAIETGAGTPEQGVARDADFRLCLIAGTMIESDDMRAMSKAYQDQDWQAFYSALSTVTKHYEAQARLYYVAETLGDGPRDLYNMRGSVAASAATVAHFRLMAVADAPAEVVDAIWRNASLQSREMFAPSLKRLVKDRKDADVSRVIKDVLKAVKPAAKPTVAQDKAVAHIEDSLKALAEKMIMQEIGTLKSGAFDMHTRIRGNYEQMFGDTDKLAMSFGKAKLDSHYKRLMERVEKGTTDFSGVDIQKAAWRCMVAQTEGSYRLSKAYQAQDWQGFCLESAELAKTIGDLINVLEVNVKQFPENKTLQADIDASVVNGEMRNKFFQLHMILEAPAEAIKFVWSHERKEDITMYAPMMKQLADARADADVSKVVDDLIAGAKPVATAKPKAPRAPKK